ncbi:MAG: family 20 glycosylhydrolase [Chloroflexi bacterium]|nr:family 20 glycosylhydrolase [Chloroflexota bacterium]
MPEKSLILLPMPRQLNRLAGTVKLPVEALIAIASPQLLFEAKTAQQALEAVGLTWPIVAGEHYENIGLQLAIDDTVPIAEGYALRIENGQIVIHGADAAGVYYGVCTLCQLIQQHATTLPALAIEDFPDFPARGVMLDVSRDRVPKMETLYALIDKLASWKANQLQLYMEHAFAYQNHREVWAEASPFTGQEILELDAYCRQRHIQLVPNQNSLGHVERWLKFPRYLPLAEKPEGFSVSWDLPGKIRPPSTLNPLDPGSLDLIYGLYDELLPHFTSRLLNVGGDEPWELGKGKSQAAVEERGGRVYLEYLLKLHEKVAARGHQMQFWGDIIVKYPDLVPELPTDAVPMLWGYEASDPPESECAMMAAAGLEFYVCPGTSTWNSLAGRTDNAMGNLRTAATNGRQYGATGYLNTEWGDNGHWQPLAPTYLGFAFGAAMSWCVTANTDLDIPTALDLYAFQDKAGVMGRLAYDLGNVYQLIDPHRHNGNLLVYSLQTPRQFILEAMDKPDQPITVEKLRNFIKQIDEIIGRLPQAQFATEEGPLVSAEYQQAANLLRHAAKRVLWLFGELDQSPQKLAEELRQLVEQQKINWLARHRVGGLNDSIQRFEFLFEEYRQG